MGHGVFPASISPDAAASGGRVQALISRVSDVSEFKLPAINTEKRLHNEDGWLSARGDGKALNIRLWLGALLSHCPALTLPYPCRALHGRVIGRSYKFAAVRALT